MANKISESESEKNEFWSTTLLEIDTLKRYFTSISMAFPQYR
jgi:hypothetical protein